METAVTLVSPALADLPGQGRYVAELRRHLPGVPRHVELWRPSWAHGAAPRTLAALASLPFVRAGPAEVVHGTDTFCTVRGVDVVTVHDLIPLLVSREWTARLHARWFRERLRRAELITLTETWADRIARIFDVPRGSLHVIPQGCAIAPPQGRTAWPQGPDAGTRTVLVVGAYRPYKRVHDAIRAVAALPRTRLVRVGPPGQGAYAAACRQLARRLGCDFLDVGPVDERGLARHYAAADVLFYASEEEGFGLPPLEAMACGTTSLVSDIPVFRELYGDLVAYTTGDLRSDLRAVLDAPREPATLRAHAARFTWPRTAARTHEVHRVAAERHGKSLAAASGSSKALQEARPLHAQERARA